MCILCVIQKWSRRVATMLPWLVIPLIALWALSQLLPPAFRFEITSPKLACVFVLLITLFWYEILMPQLSAWRVRRNALLRERKRTEAIELQKLRKTATKKCRNCLTPYRDQNPGGGKFMCSYCGHVSKRPVLDMPMPFGSEKFNSGLIKDIVGKGGKMFNNKSWSESNWMCNQDWLENGNWVSGQVAPNSIYLRKNGAALFGRDSDCMSEKSYSGVIVFTCKLLSSFFMSVRWIWRKIYRVGSLDELNSSDADNGMLTKRGENGVNCQESRGEKARRKAEEKRQARIEKELEEEEERKQREEVARLVEERRKLRDEKMKAEKGHSKPMPSIKEKEDQKEAEKKRHDRKKERDKGSSKSNSDVEDLDKKSIKEAERKKESEKKCELGRQEHVKLKPETVKTVDSVHYVKSSQANYGRSNAGVRYLDRMRGTLLSSSRAFGGSGLFGSVNAPHTVVKEGKFCSVDHAHTSFRRGISPPVPGKPVSQGDDKSGNRSVILEPPRVTPKKSWQQLFTRSPSASEIPNVISRPNSKLPSDNISSQHTLQSQAVQSFDNPISFGLPSPFVVSPYSNVSSSNSLQFSKPIDPIYSRGVDRTCEIVPEEPELFEDPCYVPDPMSLLGPVSESLDNFQLDRGSGSASFGLDRMNTVKNISVSSEVIKPSPIESPLARLKADEKHNNFSCFPTTPTKRDGCSFPAEDAHLDQGGTWQMWKSSPLGHDGLGLVSVSGNWLLSQEWNNQTKEDFRPSVSKKTMASLFSKDDHVFSGNQSPKKVLVGDGQGGAFSPVAGSCVNDQLFQNGAVPSLCSLDDHFSLKTVDESSHNEVIYDTPTATTIDHSSFQSSPVHQWSTKERVIQGAECFGNSPVRNTSSGISTHAPNVQSLWSFN